MLTPRVMDSRLRGSDEWDVRPSSKTDLPTKLVQATGAGFRGCALGIVFIMPPEWGAGTMPNGVRRHGEA